MRRVQRWDCFAASWSGRTPEVRARKTRLTYRRLRYFYRPFAVNLSYLMADRTATVCWYTF